MLCKLHKMMWWTHTLPPRSTWSWCIQMALASAVSMTVFLRTLTSYCTAEDPIAASVRALRWQWQFIGMQSRLTSIAACFEDQFIHIDKGTSSQHNLSFEIDVLGLQVERARHTLCCMSHSISWYHEKHMDDWLASAVNTQPCNVTVG